MSSGARDYFNDQVPPMRWELLPTTHIHWNEIYRYPFKKKETEMRQSCVRLHIETKKLPNCICLGTAFVGFSMGFSIFLHSWLFLLLSSLLPDLFYRISTGLCIHLSACPWLGIGINMDLDEVMVPKDRHVHQLLRTNKISCVPWCLSFIFS